MRLSYTTEVSHLDIFKKKLLQWSNQFGHVCVLDNNNYTGYPYQDYECVAGIGCKRSINPSINKLESLNEFQALEKDWLFGHLSYDLKNEIEDLTSANQDNLNFPDLHLFVPEIVILLKQSLVTILSFTDPFITYNDIEKTLLADNTFHTSVSVINRIKKQDYLNKISAIKKHIRKGDTYELNFCQEFFSENTIIDPLAVFIRLNTLSPSPFAAYYKLKDKFLLCSSPERFLKKEGNKLISQPIKGTLQRTGSKNEKDLLIQFTKDKKEIAENVMIVDLVRNDFGRISQAGSIKVEELLGIYSFPQVYQMISTITSQLEGKKNLYEILKAVFPMGSMTGAPKIKAMELIEYYEETKRGLFSGSVGYITPDGNFDFNVVIRSILYNSSNKYLSFHTGSGITHGSIPEKEYEECLVKAAAMKKILQ